MGAPLLHPPLFSHLQGCRMIAQSYFPKHCPRHQDSSPPNLLSPRPFSLSLVYSVTGSHPLLPHAFLHRLAIPTALTEDSLPDSRAVSPPSSDLRLVPLQIPKNRAPLILSQPFRWEYRISAPSSVLWQTTCLLFRKEGYRPSLGRNTKNHTRPTFFLEIFSYSLSHRPRRAAALV